MDINSASTIRCCIYTIEDVMYVHSFHTKIVSLYQFLRNYFEWSNSKSVVSYTEFRKKHKADSHLLPIMKQYGYSDDESKWKREYPTKADAVFLQLKIREYYREAKEEEEIK